MIFILLRSLYLWDGTDYWSQQRFSKTAEQHCDGNDDKEKCKDSGKQSSCVSGLRRGQVVRPVQSFISFAKPRHVGLRLHLVVSAPYRVVESIEERVMEGIVGSHAAAPFGRLRGFSLN
jgi:hypothetical protein